MKIDLEKWMFITKITKIGQQNFQIKILRLFIKRPAYFFCPKCGHRYIDADFDGRWQFKSSCQRGLSGFSKAGKARFDEKSFVAFCFGAALHMSICEGQDNNKNFR